jgi:aryl-alcohol dehydrogenase-like predicted oxidoreductase
MEDEVIPTLQELGIGFVPYCPLGRGFLTGAITSVDELAPNDFRRISPRFQGENFDRNRQPVEQVQAVAQARGATAAQVAIAWVLRSAPGSVPIPGTTRPERIDENVAALAVELTDEDLAVLNEAFPPGVATGTRWPAPMMALLNG